MNQTLTDIIERRSCRAFDPNKKISEEVLHEVINAGLYAPTGRNLQQTLFIAVTQPKALKELSDLNRRIGGWQEGFDPFYNAPCAVIVIAPKDNVNSVRDGSLGLGYMMLAAKALGLASCWINRAEEAFLLPEGRRLLDDLGIKGNYIGIGNLALGYALKTDAPEKKIKEGRVYFVR